MSGLVVSPLEVLWNIWVFSLLLGGDLLLNYLTQLYSLRSAPSLLKKCIKCKVKVSSLLKEHLETFFPASKFWILFLTKWTKKRIDRKCFSSITFSHFKLYHCLSSWTVLGKKVLGKFSEKLFAC